MRKKIDFYDRNNLPDESLTFQGLLGIPGRIRIKGLTKVVKSFVELFVRFSLSRQICISISSQESE